MKKAKSSLFAWALLSVAALLEACSGNSPQQSDKAIALNKNIAWQDQQVRFTVITDGVIRMEYAADGKFTNNPSFVATIREYPKSNFTVKETEQFVLISTPKMCMSYQKGTGRFTANNLSIQSDNTLSKTFVWHPGDEQKENLGGTYRTLDCYDGNEFFSWVDGKFTQGNDMPLEKGLLARDGWTLIDDSEGLLFGGDVNDASQPGLPWVKERNNDNTSDENGKSQDWYFMAYGHDYKQALNDFTVFAGRIPLPPRFVFGYWWSRYWSYSDAEMRKVVEDFKAYNIPLDVLVVDMDWHWVEQGKGGWTGYTWNDRLFPSPEKFLQYLKDNDLKITLNLHPADGVPAYEDKYAQLAEFLGRDPKSTETIPYVGSDSMFMRGWLDKMLLPLQKQGVDFWWLDWQQQLQDSKIPSLSNTWWINYCVFDNQRRTQPEHRPMLYHRWGGLGNHRYQIGFSGDAYSTWSSLAFQPYFNSTASNVGYGYWSHDLGGHMFVAGDNVLDRELYTRWMQLGTYLPVMRSHSTKNASMKKEPWNLGPEYQPIVTAAIKQRYTLAPYIYTAAREAFESGVSICRPLYYDYPEAEEAYAADFRNEYMFGSQMLVAPITAPMHDGVSTVKVWLPEGEWFETATGTLLKGGQVHERRFLIDEYPVYVKAGSIIPTTGTDVKNLASCDDKICIDIYPGAKESEGVFYEDNGNDRDYANNYATTRFASKSEGNMQTITLGARQGNYDGMPAKRSYAARVYGVAIPSEVIMDGRPVEYSYDPAQLALTVEMGNPNPTTEHTLVITYPENVPELNNGLVGQFRRVKNTMTEMKFRDSYINYLEGLGEMGSVCEAINYFPSEFNSRIVKFSQSYSILPVLLDHQHMSAENKEWFLKSVVY
ncbi:MAG: DUF5110 domain-containing protein [Marinilabiliaceae bacterium]|nr:DUF5110 domain-containing protein [Marinilabiliaceae bacterium]